MTVSISGRAVQFVSIQYLDPAGTRVGTGNSRVEGFHIARTEWKLKYVILNRQMLPPTGLRSALSSQNPTKIKCRRGLPPTPFIALSIHAAGEYYDLIS